MGHYTEIFINVDLKSETPDEVISTLKSMCEYQNGIGEKKALELDMKREAAFLMHAEMLGLNIPKRIISLHEAGLFQSLSDLIGASTRDIIKYRGVGLVSIRMMERDLKRVGLKFGDKVVFGDQASLEIQECKEIIDRLEVHFDKTGWIKLN